MRSIILALLFAALPALAQVSPYSTKPIGVGTGTVTDVSVTTANGVSGSVATSTSTPAITLTLGAITPTSVATPSIIMPNSGAAATVGNATLVGGAATVTTTAATANAYIMLTRKTSGGTIGTAVTYTIMAGTSFTITSDNILDTSTFTWLIVKGS